MAHEARSALVRPSGGAFAVLPPEGRRRSTTVLLPLPPPPWLPAMVLLLLPMPSVLLAAPYDTNNDLKQTFSHNTQLDLGSRGGRPSST